MNSTVTIFDKDDTPFFAWMNAHPNGFVLNTERRKNSRYAVIHQSNCFHISGYTSAYTSNPFTAGPYIKVCADSVEALEIWLQQNRPNAKKTPQYCKTCAPPHTTGNKKYSGYWTFFCNPAKWQIDRFLEENITDDIYQVTDRQKGFFQPGQLGVIRVGIDHRTKKELGDRPKLQPGIYAIVEIRSRHKKRKNAPDDYWLTYLEKDKEKPVVDIRFLKNLLNNPILIADLKSDPAIDDPYLIPGFQATTMPLTPQSFQRILELSDNVDPDSKTPALWSLKWKKPVTLKSGKLRKSYISWKIPAKLLKKYNIEDGMTFWVKVSIPERHYELEQESKITSGGEISLSKLNADEMKAIAQQHPNTKLHFLLNLPPNFPTASSLSHEFEEQVTRSTQDPSSNRRKRLKTRTRTKPEQVTVTSIAYKRNPDVVAEVLYRANGICEECGQPAPFRRKTDGTPYLEVHHIRTLAKGGDDTVKNAVALCPNCHRKAHYG